MVHKESKTWWQAKGCEAIETGLWKLVAEEWIPEGISTKRKVVAFYP